MTAFAYTTEFRQQFELETASLLRKRFLWFAAIAAGLSLLQFAMRLMVGLQAWVGAPEGAEATAAFTRRTGIDLTHDLLTALLYAGVLLYVRRKRLNKHTLLRLSFLCIMLDGAMDVAAATAVNAAGLGVLRVVLAHSLAALLLPWSPRQALLPMLPVLGLNALSWLIWREFTIGGLFWIVFSTMAAAPGVVIAFAKDARRTEQFKLRFLQDRYGMIRRELVDARRIHEALFPHPIRSGPLRFDYRYEPMLQIGGDYLYAKFSPPRGGEPPAFNMILIDVTGHGIAAALTVNRLYGEVERLFAEAPHARPGDILRALNRYVHLTLANHSVFVTALCVRVDIGRGQLEYASGGHPPAFLRAVDGTVDQLASTAFVLGACPDDEFDPAPEQRQFGPGDSLIAYTDGAIEARDDTGKVLGIRGVMRVLASPRSPSGADAVGGWIEAVLAAVEGHRVGPPRDDTIVVEIARAIPAHGERRASTTEVQVQRPAPALDDAAPEPDLSDTATPAPA